MIVQCDQCNAKFRLDDAKVKDEGVKVRCSKCKHVFVVRKEMPAEDPDFDSILGGLESSPPEERTAAATASQAPLEESAAHQRPSDAADDEWAMDFGAAARETAPDLAEAAPSGTAPEWLAEGSDSQAASMEWQTPAAVGTEQRVEESTDDLSSLFSSGGMKEEKAPEFDLGEFDFGSDGVEQAEDAADSISEEKTANLSDETVVVEKGVPAESFSSFDDFSETMYMGSAGKKPPAQEPEEFSFGDPFAEGDWETGAETGAADESPVASAPKMEEASPDEFFSFAESAPKNEGDGTFDFAVEGADATLAVAKNDGAEPAWDRAEDVTMKEFAEAEQSGASQTFVPFSVAEEEEMPPSVISTRRKGNRAFGLVLGTLGVLVMLLLVGGGYYYFAKGPAAFEGLGLGAVSKWLGKESAEEGKISVVNPVGAFLVNQEAGELFVVTGNAVNDFKKPRASIQIKVTLYGPKGAASQQKTVYAGNVLSKEQLATLPFAKIEAAMNNQFGDSLANLGVQPGKNIPFVVVFDKVPRDVTDFGVEAAGSTFASQ